MMFLIYVAQVHLGAEASWWLHLNNIGHQLIICPGGSRSRGRVLPGGDGAEVAGAAAEEAGHGAGGGAQAGDEHAAQVTPDGKLNRICM